MINVYFVLLLIIAVLMFSLAFSSLSLAPWVPTRKRDLKRAFKLAGLKPGEIFYDLGSGTGTTVFGASAEEGVKAIGIELALPMYFFSVLKKLILRDKNAHFKLKSLFNEDLSQADVVYVFGLPNTLKEKLVTKFKKELKPGSRVLSYVFPIHSLVPEVVDRPTDKDLSIYLYKF